MSSRRLLWLLNDSKMREFEVPLLIDMGYEVFCPKFYAVDFRNPSAMVTYEYDSSLTIPEEDLKIINQIDFYSNLSIDSERIINQYFDIAFCMLHLNQIRSLLLGFNGITVLRTCSFDKQEPFADQLAKLGNAQLLSMISNAGNKFWFGDIYKKPKTDEPPLLKQRRVYLPIGMAFDEEKSDKWVGGDKRFLFINPGIRTDQGSMNEYDRFMEDFGDLSHVVGGMQMIPIENGKNVCDFSNTEEKNYILEHVSAMYCSTSCYKQFDHYPFEAIYYGIPVVFMAGSVLDRFGGDKLPGRCKNIQQARNKLLRLQREDKSLEVKIRESQRTLLEQFERKSIESLWINGMKKIESSLSGEVVQETRKVAIIVPSEYLGGVLDYSIRLALSLKKAIDETNVPLRIVFAYMDSDIYDRDIHFKKIIENNIELRKYKPQKKDRAWLSKRLGHAGMEPILINGFEKMCVFGDEMKDFEDCDFAIMTSDLSPIKYPAFLPILHAVVVHDYIQHYAAGVVSEESNAIKLINQNQADYVFTTSKTTKEDAICFGGHDAGKVLLTPYLLRMNPPISKRQYNENSTYFLWSTNISRHKNHKNALLALAKYYRMGGNLNCYMTGSNTEYFLTSAGLEPLSEEAEDYVNEIRKVFVNNQSLRHHVFIQGFIDFDTYYDLMANASFVFHPGIADNGSGAVVDGAALGIPSLVSNYPAMRDIQRFTGIPFRYMDPFSIENISDALIDMEKNRSIYAGDIPQNDDLIRADYMNQGHELLDIVRGIMKL